MTHFVWKQYECKKCGATASARIKSVCGILEICGTCSRKTNLDTRVLCFGCRFNDGECLNVIQTCLNYALRA